MFDRTVRCDLLWAPGLSEAVDVSQRWILTAMERYGSELVTMLWRILGNEQDVCDAYQTTFLQLAHRDDRRQPRHIKAYLFRTASNAAITMLRRRVVESRTLSEMEIRAQRAESTEPDFDAQRLTERLRSLIAELPDPLRSVIALRDLGELPYEEVARTLQISTGTARVYRCKAVQLLAAWMNREVQP
jgi:RNA polymerase sigma-70 factor (ECF subfamily)